MARARHRGLAANRALYIAILVVVVALVVGGAFLFFLAPEEEKLTIRWGTSRVGSSGYKALTTLAQVINNVLPNVEIVVEPQSGAIASMKGFARGDLDGAYGADIAFREMYTQTGRFEGFQGMRMPVQTLWVFTIDIGLAVPKDRADEFACWRDIAGKRVFTLPLGWDTGTALRKALESLGISFEHVELDLEAVATSLNRGDIVATGIYVTGERGLAPWIQNMLAQTDLVLLNPCPDEIEKLKAAGIPVSELPTTMFPEDVGREEFVGVRIYYGFHVGLNLDEDTVYELIKAVEANIEELARLDPAFSQVAKDFVGFQVEAVESLIDMVPVHPGLAKYLKEKGVWKEEWKIAGS